MKKIYFIFFAILIPIHAVYSQISVASKELDSLIRAFDQTENLEERIGLSIRIGQKAINSDFKLAMQFAKISIDLANQQDDLNQKLSAVENAGTIAFYMGLSQEAVDLKLRALELADSIGDLYKIARAQFNLGATQLYLNQLNEAQKNTTIAQNLFREYYEGSEELMPLSGRLTILNNLGQIAIKLGDYSLAETHYREGKELIRGQESMKDEAALRLLSGYTQLKLFQKQPMEAIKLGKEVLEDYKNAGVSSLQFEAVFFNYLGQAWEKLNELDSALLYNRRGYYRASQINATAGKRLLASDLARIFEKINQPDSALYYLKIADDLLQEEDKANAKAKLQQTELVKAFKEKEEEILEIESQKRVGLTVILISILAFIAAITIIAWRRNRKVKHDIEEKEQQISLLEQDREQLSLNIEEREKELTTKALDDIQRSETMRTLINELRGAIISKQGTEARLNKMLHKIENSNSDQNIWEEFKLRFERTHQSFYDNLLQKHPELTSNERRLCAFLRLDMTTKEISTITGQSVRAIQIARIRLRKKFEMSNRQTTLFEYLNQF